MPSARMAEAAEALTGRGANGALPDPVGDRTPRRAGAAYSRDARADRAAYRPAHPVLSASANDICTPLTRMRLASRSCRKRRERAALAQDVKDMESMLDAFLNFARGEGAGPTNNHRARGAYLFFFFLFFFFPRRRKGPPGAGCRTRPARCQPTRWVLVELTPVAIKRALENLCGRCRDATAVARW